MTQNEILEQWFTGWNEKKEEIFRTIFSEHGTYEDPTTRMALLAFDIGGVLKALAAVYPDFKFEIVDTNSMEVNTTVTWILRATNSQPLKPGILPTGKSLHLRGVDVVSFDGEGKIAKALRFYDQKTMAEQIGMQVIIEPISQGKATYGYSKRVSSGSSKPPAVVAMTWIGFKDQSELDHIRTHSAQIIANFEAQPGFISIVTGAAGDRAFTVTAWENEDALYAALGKHHAEAKQDFRTGDIAPAVWTSVWKPIRIGRNWVRCTSCNQPNDMTDNHESCANCGTKLPPRQSYWWSMIEVSNLDHCGIIVPDLDSAIEWYSTHLGFSLLNRRDEIHGAPDWKIAFLKVGTSRLELLEQKSMQGKINWQPGTELFNSFIGKKHIAFRVPDVAKVFADLQSKKLHLIRPVAYFPEFNVRFCHFADPWGNILEFLDDKEG